MELFIETLSMNKMRGSERGWATVNFTWLFTGKGDTTKDLAVWSCRDEFGSMFREDYFKLIKGARI